MCFAKTLIVEQTFMFSHVKVTRFLRCSHYTQVTSCLVIGNSGRPATGCKALHDLSLPDESVSSPNYILSKKHMPDVRLTTGQDCFIQNGSVDSVIKVTLR